MLRVGLTGGIGSGKTTVSDHFENLGVPVIDTDEIARQLTSSGSPALSDIVREFGPEIVERGELNRDALRRRVFDDPGQRLKLEAILHPRIRDEVANRVAELDAPYCLIVVPLMVETNFQDLVDRVLVVEAPRTRRLAWIRDRRGLSETQIEQIMAVQASDQQRAAIADERIVNDGDIAQLQQQVEQLHEFYLQRAGHASA